MNNLKLPIPVGDIGVIITYLLSTICGLAIFIFGFGYNVIERNQFGKIAMISVIFMFVYMLLCNHSKPETNKYYFW